MCEPKNERTGATDGARRYLKVHHRITYDNLLTICKLNGYLADIGKQAEEMFFRLV